MVSKVKISVLLSEDEAEKFDEYCRREGYKKSTLIARLIREHLDKSSFHMQMDLLKDKGRENGKKR